MFLCLTPWAHPELTKPLTALPAEQHSKTQTQIHRTWVSVWPEWGWEQRLSLPLRKTRGLISALLSAGPFSQRLTHIWCCDCERLLNPETRPVFPSRMSAIGSVQRRPLPVSPVSEDLEQHREGVPSAEWLCIKNPRQSSDPYRKFKVPVWNKLKAGRRFPT